MEIDQKELDRRLNSSRNLKNSLVSDPSNSRPSGTTNSSQGGDPCTTEDVKSEIHIIPIEKKTSHSFPPDANIRILAGSLALQGVPAREISEEMNLTIEQVISAKRTKNPEVAGPRDASIERVRELALSKTMEALGLMTPDKFINANLKDLSAVANNLSNVIHKTAPKEVAEDNRVQFMIYAPQERSEKSYKVIDV